MPFLFEVVLLIECDKVNLLVTFLPYITTNHVIMVNSFRPTKKANGGTSLESVAVST